MDKMQDFRIEFDNPSATYTTGDTVTGRVILVLSGPKNVREIRIKAKGEAEVQWSEQRTVSDKNGSHTVTDHYSNSESYFNMCAVLVGAGSEETIIPAGRHSYPFSFRIPTNVPCSFEHHVGHVRYTAKAVIDRPWKFDHKVLSGFTVIADYDLNAHPHLARGIHDEIERNFHSFLCFGDAGTLTAIVKSRVKGFVPGETIQLDISYNNSSTSVDVEGIKLSLKKDMMFHATTKSKRETDTVQKVIKDGLFLENGEASLRLEVPPMAPSNLEHCSIISISYRLVLKIETSGMHRKIKHIYPIEIGTIPLQYQVSNQVQPSPVPSAPPINQVAADTQPLPAYPDVASQPIRFMAMDVPPYTEMPPPSYEECIGGTRLIADPNEEGMVGANTQFAPKYPVYRFPMPMPQSS